jgi:hypothetical protein
MMQLVEVPPSVSADVLPHMSNLERLQLYNAELPTAAASALSKVGGLRYLVMSSTTPAAQVCGGQVGIYPCSMG